MVSGFWTGIALVVLLAAALVAALRVSSGHADLDWRRKDLRDLETGDHRRPRETWWRRLFRRS